MDLLGHGENPQPSDPRQYHAQLLYTAFRRWLDLPTRTLLLWSEQDSVLRTEPFADWLEDMQDAAGQSLGGLGHAPSCKTRKPPTPPACV